MQMPYIWICSAYVGFSLFRSDPISGSSGSAFITLPRCGPGIQHVVAYPADFYAICCVLCRFRDRARRGRKGRFACSLTVEHFRKSRNTVKTGSHRNGHPVIYLSGYLAAYYQAANDCVRENHPGDRYGAAVDSAVRHNYYS